MIKIEESSIINRPASEVFAFVADQVNAPRWQRGLDSVRRIGDGPIGVGTRHEFVRSMMGRRMSGENEYTRFEPDRCVAFTATSGGWPLEASYEVKPTGEQATRLTSRIELAPSGAFRILQPLFAAGMRRDVRANLATLKALLEAKDGRHSSSA